MPATPIVSPLPVATAVSPALRLSVSLLPIISAVEFVPTSTVALEAVTASFTQSTVTVSPPLATTLTSLPLTVSDELEPPSVIPTFDPISVSPVPPTVSAAYVPAEMVFWLPRIVAPKPLPTFTVTPEAFSVLPPAFMSTMLPVPLMNA